MKIICAGGAPAASYFATSTTSIREAGHTGAEIQFEHLREGQ
jgi:hypothetical protein